MISKLWGNAWASLHTDLVAQVIAGVIALLLLVVLVTMAKRIRGRDLNAKKTIGLGLVQVGVTFIIVTGVYGFFRNLLNMPEGESALMAVFVQAAEWGAVGSIYAHTKGTDEDGRPNTGFGPAGPFFWVVTFTGGTLAVIASGAATVAVGRIAIVCIGAYMWYLQLVQIVRRSAGRSRWRWTPKALLLAIGALTPVDDDIQDDAREWQVRKIARAIRWSNSRRPWSWFGDRALAKRAETVSPDVIEEGRRRYAEAYVLRNGAALNSEIMSATISTVRAGQLGEQIDAIRAEAERAAERLQTERAEHAEQIAQLTIARDEADDRSALLRTEVQMLREQAERTVERLRLEHAEQIASLRAEHAEQLAAVRAEQASGASRADRSGADRSATGGGRSAQRTPRPAASEHRAGAQKYTDDQAIRLMLAEHPEHDYEWGSREVNRITGAGFGRIPRLIAMVAEHHARSTGAEQVAADRSSDGDDSAERAG